MTRARIRVVRLVLLVGLPLAVLVGGAIVWQQGGRIVSTENAYVKADIAQIAPEVSGRVIQVGVRDHDHVQAGAVLPRYATGGSITQAAPGGSDGQILDKWKDSGKPLR